MTLIRNSQHSIGDPIIAACKERFENNFTEESPFDKLTALSKVEGPRTQRKRFYQNS